MRFFSVLYRKALIALIRMVYQPDEYEELSKKNNVEDAKFLDQTSSAYAKAMEIGGLLHSQLELNLDIVCEDLEYESLSKFWSKVKKVDYLWVGVRWQDPGVAVEWAHCLDGMKLTTK